MIRNIKLNNLGKIESLDAGLGNINLFIGPNSSGKSFAIKTMYATLRAMQMNRGDETKTMGQLIGSKLLGCFDSGGHQQHLRSLVSIEREAPMQMEMVFDSPKGSQHIAYEIPKNSKSDSVSMCNPAESKNLTRENETFFLPTKEVLTIYRAVIESRSRNSLKDFDDTYYDLAVAISTAMTEGRNYDVHAKVRRELESLLGGKLKKDDTHWSFEAKYQKEGKSYRSKASFNLGVLSEGVKKLSILDVLLGNRRLEPGSVVFIDEPESTLHPRTLKSFIDIIIMLAEDAGIQFFIASHSYLVLHWLADYAKANYDKNEISLPLPLIDIEEGHAKVSDLCDGIPDNGIDQERIDAYLKELEDAFR